MGEFDNAMSAPTFEISAARDALARMRDAIETHLSHEEADLPEPVREQLGSNLMPKPRTTVDALVRR